jgi:hypothetical protein
VKSLAEFQKIFDDGCARRLMGQTVDVSSRSHAILTVTMSSSTFSGKLNLVDLAGTLNLFQLSPSFKLFHKLGCNYFQQFLESVMWVSMTVLPYTFCVSHYIHMAVDNFFETKVSCGLQKQGMRLTAKHAMM